MSEYLTKEEIKQWRSSLEKITLEEYAARLGKQIEEAKETNDIVDMVLKGKSYMSPSSTSDMPVAKAEKINSIAERTFDREQQITSYVHFVEPAKRVKKETQKPAVESKKSAVEEAKKITAAAEKAVTAKAENKVSAQQEVKNAAQVKAPETTLKEEVQITFKKALTDREQMVFDYFLQNKNKVVYAKDLATLLNLPRDYVYKYIKNLRAKIEGENLKNGETGGFILSD